MGEDLRLLPPSQGAKRTLLRPGPGRGVPQGWQEKGTNLTDFEVKFPAKSVGWANSASGDQIGLGFVVNEGDLTSGENGWQWWDAWGRRR